MLSSEAQIVKALIKQFKTMADDHENYSWLDPQCIDCTANQSPADTFCGYHAACRLMRGQTVAVQKEAV